ncbi:hypothetical protein EDC04DRAFT_2598413 [Pisolithus marmoratus]|nr:hypothetical protein EDC04DRAFT_2598413 [Pisolithus marmoratus]
MSLESFLDRYSLSMILLGTTGSGISYLVIRSGKLKAADGFLLTIQFVALLHNSTVGQPFLASFSVSPTYDLRLSAVDKKKIQKVALMTRLLRHPRTCSNRG